MKVAVLGYTSNGFVVLYAYMWHGCDTERKGLALFHLNNLPEIKFIQVAPLFLKQL